MNRPLADDGQPKPYQVRLALTALLGTLEPGQPLPPERVLAADFGVSRSTVRHAITDMVAAGLVQRLHDLGDVEDAVHVACLAQSNQASISLVNVS